MAFLYGVDDRATSAESSESSQGGNGSRHPYRIHRQWQHQTEITLSAADPITSVGGDTMEVELQDLGDDLPYAFGVRACSIKGVCDTNDLALLASTRDDGAPKTTGASALLVRDGGLVITARVASLFIVFCMC